MSDDTAAFYLCIASVIGVVLLAMAGVVWRAVRSEDSWLTRGKKQALGEGGYRSGPSVSDPRLLERRWIVTAVAVINIPWAAVTLFILVPAGLVAGLVASSPVMNRDNWFMWAMTGAAIDGIPVSILLAVGAFTLVRRSPKAMPVNLLASAWSFAHHAVITTLGIVYALPEDYGERQLGFCAAIIASIGVAHAVAIGIAAWLARPEPAPAPQP